MRPLTLILALLLTGGFVRAQTNDTEQCLELMDEWIEELEAMEHVASNATARAECIADKLNKIKGLRELTANSVARLPRLIAENDTTAVAAENAAIVIACARARKLAAEASVCDDALPGKTRKLRPLAEPATPPRSDASQRNEDNCIKHAEFARLLLQVMQLSPEPESARGPTDELARFAIEPMGGWRPEACVTLDDFSVTIVRALNLKVETPRDPAAYLQALREAALPVDVLLPARADSPPPLLESEVRGFLAQGYAAPLPTSRRLVPE